jgi:prephenate dehydrogenase
MWTPIFEQNQQNILEVLQEYIANLEVFKKNLEEKNYESIYNQMQQTNAIKTILAGINQNNLSKQ